MPDDLTKDTGLNLVQDRRQIERVINAPPKPLTDHLEVRRALPRRGLREVGPYVFLDHIGPADFAPGEALYVPPHPHAGLQTVTYLFEGGLLHKDSIGTVQEIKPGDMNWMTAGCGIVHSEETPPALKASGHRLHGIQIWVALPQDKKYIQPSFEHHAAEKFTETEFEGATCRVLCGSWQGIDAPIETHWPTFYLDVAIPGPASFDLPVDPSFALGAYVVDGLVNFEDGTDDLALGDFAHFLPGAGTIAIKTAEPARFILVGGKPLQEKTVIFENFVLNSMDEIRQAQADYADGKFGTVEQG